MTEEGAVLAELGKGAIVLAEPTEIRESIDVGEIFPSRLLIGTLYPILRW